MFRAETLIATAAAEFSSRSFYAAINRQFYCSLRQPERVASIAKEHDHTKPAKIAQQAIRVESEVGNGWLPVSSWHRLDQIYEDIDEVIIVTPGIMRNAIDYRHFMEEARGKRFNPKKTMIVATQFPAEVDLAQKKRKLWRNRGYNNGNGVVPSHVLRWGYNDWRGGEPAQNPSAPISSFAAKDALVEHITKICPNLKYLRFKNNSEGAQMDDRYLAFSKALKKLDHDPNRNIKIEGIIQNPGTVLYFHNLRPDPTIDHQTLSDYLEIPVNSVENEWPFGMYNPPPYILEYLKEHSLDEAIIDYLDRTCLLVGKGDNDVMGSQVPIGIAQEAQGFTRYQRIKHKFQYLIGLRTFYPERNVPFARLLEFTEYDHEASQMFLFDDQFNVVDRSNNVEILK